MKETILAKATETRSTVFAQAVSLDTWAVAIALLLAILVRLGLISKVPW